MSDDTTGTGGPRPAGPYEGFGGKVGNTFAGSESWWPERPTPGPDAPNVVVVIVDDLGFADLGCYGSEIPTPNIDRLAAGGVQFTNFHVTPMCSPTRAALLTGVNPHRAGAGHVANSDPGFPGYAAELAADVATAAEVFRDAGYHTMAIGKWHLTKDADLSDAGPRHSWPLQRGFDRYYGVLDAFTNLHHPHRLVQDNHTVELDQYPDGYYVTDDLTDRAIGFIRQQKASNPSQPFFCYFAHIAVHAPLQCKESDRLNHAGNYDAGWDALRQARHERQVELGLLPEGTPLPPRNSEEGDDVTPWADLDPADQALFARYMEVYAAMVDSVDQSVGRLYAALEELGEADDTIFLFLSDNGASREGEAGGTTSYFRSLVSKNVKDLEDRQFDRDRLELAGGPRALVHYPRGWAMASNTPFRLYKINTHAGGHSVPLILHWPAGQRDPGRRDQWSHVTDLLPTLCELAGVQRPDVRGGIALQPLNGTSLGPVLADAGAAHARGPQYLEMAGHRGYYDGDWEVVTRHQELTEFGLHEWELYNLADDRTETRNLAAEHPERVAEMAAGWEAAARENQVYPLDEGSRLRYVVRPPYEVPLQQPVRIVAGTHTLERYRSQQLIQWRSFDVDVELDHAAGDQGVLVSHGDQGGGYALYVDDDGELVFVHNGYGEVRELRCGPVPDGARQIRLAVTAPGGWRWNVAVSVDGAEVGTSDDLVMLGAMAPFEGINVGIDRRSPVSWELAERHGTFPWTGRLVAVTYTPGEPAPDAGTRFLDLLREIGMRYE
ncbi:arylsulfatase [Aquihabitans sp. G128]|uniref:arylsulfatase n=1 Tax=Aquihabitans sp. G128 TaxID=2849779 RepID=UPI001C22ADDE|nr:arylsulfatase [Aquihabitans sp. G128]QXC62175.1 arylsulfatase [Aquihabitans sp. G128]